MNIDLKALGITEEELVNRIVDKAATTLLTEVTYDEDGDEIEISSSLQRKLRDNIQKGIDTAVDTLLAKHVQPLVESKLDTLLLVPTNQWGEKKGNPVTFVEYATARAEAYLTEPVNHEGKTRSENGGYSWSAHTTRVVHLANKHLQYEIDRAMKTALADVNGKITGGIEAAVKMALAEVQAKLKVEVKV